MSGYPGALGDAEGNLPEEDEFDEDFIEGILDDEEEEDL